MIIMEILKFIFSSFWVFLGSLMFAGLILHYTIHYIFKFYNRFMRMLMVRKQGWPPAHLDADGDFILKK